MAPAPVLCQWNHGHYFQTSFDWKARKSHWYSHLGQKLASTLQDQAQSYWDSLETFRVNKTKWEAIKWTFLESFDLKQNKTPRRLRQLPRPSTKNLEKRCMTALPTTSRGFVSLWTTSPSTTSQLRKYQRAKRGWKTNGPPPVLPGPVFYTGLRENHCH